MRLLHALTLFVFLSAARGETFQPSLPQYSPDQDIAALAKSARAALNSGDYTAAELHLRQGAKQAGLTGDGLRFRLVLADLFREQGRGEEALRLYQWILAVPHLPATLRFKSLIGLADIESLSGGGESSLGHWNQALALARSESSRSMEADALNGLAVAWLDAGAPLKAEPLLKDSLALLDAELPVRPWARASVLVALGRCYRLEDRLEFAEEALTRALEIDRTIFGDTHPQVAYVLERLATLVAARGEWEQARAYSDQALETMKTCCGSESPAMAAALSNRGSVERLAGNTQAALDSYAAALRIARQHPANAALQSQIVENYAPLLKAAHRGKEAKALSAFSR